MTVYSLDVLLSHFGTSLFHVQFCCFLTCIHISQEAGQVVWYSHLLKNIPQFVVIHTVKGYSIVNDVEVGNCYLFNHCLYSVCFSSSTFAPVFKICSPVAEYLFHVILYMWFLPFCSYALFSVSEISSTWSFRPLIWSHQYPSSSSVKLLNFYIFKACF